MKSLKSIILVLCILSIGINSASAQDGPRFTVKTNPLAALAGPLWITIVPITGEYKVLFEAKTLPKQSITIGASYLGPSLLLNLDNLTSSDTISGIKTSGFRIQGMYKLFLTRELEAPEGLYVGPHFSYATATITNKDNTDDKFIASKLNINGVIGYQLITEGGFALDLYTGLGFKTRKYEIEGASEDIFGEIDFTDKNQAAVAFGFSFGYSF